MFSLQTNVLEAVKLDISLGYHENARIGLALTAAVQFGPIEKDHRVSWKLGKISNSQFRSKLLAITR